MAADSVTAIGDNGRHARAALLVILDVMAILATPGRGSISHSAQPRQCGEAMPELARRPVIPVNR